MCAWGPETHQVSLIATLEKHAGRVVLVKIKKVEQPLLMQMEQMPERIAKKTYCILTIVSTHTWDL